VLRRSRRKQNPLEVQNDEKRGPPRAPLVVAGRSAGPLDAACGMFAIAPLMRRGYNEYPVYFRMAFHRVSHPRCHKDDEHQHDGCAYGVGVEQSIGRRA